MSFPPVGLLSEPLARMRIMVARSSTFQVWTGTTTEASASEFVYLYRTPRKPALPLCLVDLGDQFERQRTTIMNGRSFDPTGQLALYFRSPVQDDIDDIEAMYRFTNPLGAVWKDLESMAGTRGLVGITSINLAVPPTRKEPERRQHSGGDYFEAVLACNFRLTG